MAEHGITGTADAGAFLSRLVRLDPTALVRLRTSGAARVELWGRVPWGVLVGRTVEGGRADGGDVTVLAADLLDRIERGVVDLPARRDAEWRWPLPPSAGRNVEELPVAELRRVASAAQQALRTAAAEGVRGRAVGQRALRDALLDHVPIVVTSSSADASAESPVESPVEVPQRLVQAVARMGFLGAGDAGAGGRVLVRVAARWTGLLAPYGTAWLQASQLAVRAKII